MVRHLVYYREHHNTETEQLPHFPLSQKTFKMYGELIIMWCWHRGWPHLVTIQSDPAHILLPGSLLPLSSQLPGINNRSIYWVTIWPESEADTADSHPHRFNCPHFFLVLSWYYFPLSSSQWWMYLQIFLPSFVLSQLYNWPARASVSRVSAPRVRWNWSHYRDGITATSEQPRPALWAAILKSQYWHCIEPSLSLSLPYKILITSTE